MADGDVFVLIPGILGTVLQKDGRDVFGLTAAAGFAALFSGGRSVQGLRLDEPVWARARRVTRSRCRRPTWATGSHPTGWPRTLTSSPACGRSTATAEWPKTWSAGFIPVRQN